MITAEKSVMIPPNSSNIEGQDIVCFSHDWTGDPLSKTHLMRILARNNRVLWVNSIGYRTPSINKADLSRAWRKFLAFNQPLKEVERNLYVLNPLAVPNYRFRIARTINRIWLRRQILKAMRSLDFRHVINWVFNPAAAVIAGKLGEERLIYHCVDEYSAFSGVAANAILALENELLQKANLVVVSAELLLQSKSKLNANTVLVRHGVDHAHFSRALDSATVVPAEIANLPRPIIGFFGLIADWVDVELMAEVAKRYPNGSLVALGKVTTDVSCLNLPNVHLLGRKPYDSLPSYCKGFDVAINPFRINELTLNANPLKVREYLAAGLQVISTNIPEVAVLGNCRVADNYADFMSNIDEALLTPGPLAHLSESVQSHSWESRLAEIATHLARL